MNFPVRLASVLLLALMAMPASAITISAPAASSNGSYTVSYSACTQTICYLEERVGASGAWTYVDGQTVAYYGQTGSVSFSGKPVGLYYYRAVAMEFNDWGILYTGYSPEHLVTVASGPIPTVDSFAVQSDYTYAARRGDLNFDGLQDLFIERTSGGVPGNGAIDRLILQQAAGGTFTPVVPTAGQASAAAAWATVAVAIELNDVNLDGFVDLVLRELASAIPGALGQIIFSSGQLFNSAPASLVSITSNFEKFVREVDSFAQNSNYFYANAPIVNVPVYGLVYGCQWFYDYEWGWYYSCGFYYALIGYQPAYDFSGYNQDAVAVGDSFQTVVNGVITPAVTPGSVLSRALDQAFRRVFGLPVFRGILDTGCSGDTYAYDSDATVPCVNFDLIGELFLSTVRTVTPQGQWRYLTPGEKAGAIEARLVIKDVDLVRVFNKRYLIFSKQVMAPNGDVYFDDPNVTGVPWREDYSLGPVRPDFSVLIHELMHVFQHRTWGWSKPRMFQKWAAAAGDYTYCPLVPGQLLTAYNMEEQAEMVQDLFLLSRQEGVLKASNACASVQNLDPVVRFLAF